MKKLPPWYRISPSRLLLERSIWTSLNYFGFEREVFAPDEKLLVIGTLLFFRERSGRKEEFRVGLEYPRDFPRSLQRVFDYDKRFIVGADGHLIESHQLCLTLPERREFDLTSSGVTEEVLGASLIWFDKRLIYERTQEWPGPWERHGAWGKLDVILEQAGLGGNSAARQWGEGLLNSAVINGRTVDIDVYSPCPCGKVKSLKFCHYEKLRPLLKLFKILRSCASTLDAK